ncbi:MAG: SLC13 family permease [Lunatimonas sp.]|uniref:SLC13 family permease n=1 Tax=Lunatimonas sp. TaxID=2060141 RepID=UPI00263BDA09|nr:SLC13 family permease [Lunatimonas sp.]MCC5935907.1 SLC13 family permease [Lunatimonas sp.]
MEQLLVFGTLAVALVLFIWGKPRYDLVAILALVFLALCGVVPKEEAFLGFGHTAVITVAAVLVVSKAVENSGLVNIIVQLMDKVGSSVALQVGVLCTIVAVASGFMNNIGALAILMPVAIQLARKNNYSPSVILMPIAFASLLGGMNTLIGTPPNIIISSYRASTLDGPFRMFDFSPVGVAVTVAGLVFISLIGWRILPKRQAARKEGYSFEIDNYITEVLISEGSSLIGEKVRDIDLQEDREIKVLGLVRHRQRIHAPNPWLTLREGDILILECDTDVLTKFLEETKAELVGDENLYLKAEGSSEIQVTEGIVTEHSPLIGETAASIHMRSRYGVNLLALARSNRTLRQRIDHVTFQSGDVLLLQGLASEMSAIFQSMGCYPLAKRGLEIGKPKRTIFALVVFVLTIASIVTELIPVEIAFILAAFLLVSSKILPVKDLYQAIDWPIIVLLGAMIPVGIAFETSGAAETITSQIMRLGTDFPVWGLLAILLFVTMLLSAVINNAATVLLMAPIAVKIATSMDASADPFLMAVAIGGSAAFLTPIGHQSNTLVMSPGGYRFGDYWKLGLPLTVLITAVAIPLILLIWPPFGP